MCYYRVGKYRGILKLSLTYKRKDSHDLFFLQKMEDYYFVKHELDLLNNCPIYPRCMVTEDVNLDNLISTRILYGCMDKK